MLRQTVDRLGDLATPHQTLIVTNRRLIAAIGEQLPEFPATSLVGEPCKRDTAPCIGLAALLVSRRDADAIMAVLPADHVIRQTDRFRQAIRQAARQVASSSGRIVTFGIRPTYPAEIFGYIQRGPRTRSFPMGASADPTAVDEAPAYEVQRFREKPNAAAAAEFLASGDFYWNSGIFVWHARTVLEALSERQPEMLRRLRTIVDAWGTDRQDAIFTQEFAAIAGISIDYAVMEHAHNVGVIEAPFDWDDLGSWQSLSRLLGTDAHGNTVVGRHIGVDSQGCIVRSEGEHLVVTLGLRNCLIVHTPEATLVANKADEEAIRNVVKEIETRGWTEYL